MSDRAPEPTGSGYDGSAPNVVVIVLDDLGFAQLGCYGSDLQTPNLDRLAERGVQFTNFHTTAICSPTRACLLTGRNHHRVGMGMLPDLPVNFPAYRGVFPDGAGTMAEILRDEGYATFAIGKWHLTPRDQRDVGPYRMWPLGQGFDRYYGFLNGETNLWTPNLVRDNAHVEPPATPDDGYHLEADLADEAIAHIDELRRANPSRPFLLWYATATPHAPHQVGPEWIEPYRGAFDAGWDDWRAATLERQKALGVVPADTQLSDRPEWVEPWNDIDADRRRLYARMMEVYAGFLTHADHQIGRVLDHLDRIGELDDTIVVVVSDNGCSAEGGPNGSFNQLRHYVSDEPDDLTVELDNIDELGGFRSSGHYPWGWALAGNTPFRRWKRYTFEGGVRDPMIVSWPSGIVDRGGVRDQYCHAIDVLPTVLDLLGVDPPAELRGVQQMSLDGQSVRAVLDEVDHPPSRTTQYYECWGSRAIYRDGWKAVTNHVNQLTRAERDHLAGSDDFATDRWALYDVANDPTEANDLAGQRLDVLDELVTTWWTEAERNQVLPLDDSRDGRLLHLSLPYLDARTEFSFRRGDKVHEASGPLLFGGYRVMAEFDGPIERSADFVLCEQGDWLSGWAWIVRDGRLRWMLAGFGGGSRVEAALPDEYRLLTCQYTPVTGGAEIELFADTELIGAATIDDSAPAAWAPDGAFLTVGYGRPFPVADDYDPSAWAPEALDVVRFSVMDTEPLDLEAELDRVMRHQ